MKTPKLILVTVDFTRASVSATKFALGLVEHDRDQIQLLHIVDSEDDEVSSAIKLGLFADEYIPSTITFSTKVVRGKIAVTIGQFADTIKASLIVLGTHCKTGIGKLFNSYAFQIVEHCHSPFIIVQEETTYKAIKKIILTIDTERESMHILRTAAALGKMFDAEILLVAAYQKDPEFKSKSDRNLLICKKYLTEQQIKHSVELVDGKDFIGNIFRLSADRGVDMIAATYYQQHFHIFTDSFVRTLANNELHIPLLTMENETTHSAGQFGAMFG